MAPIGCDIMDYASPHEGQQGSTLTGLAQSFRLQSPFLGDYSLHQASPMSPVSALGHGFNSPGLLSGVEPALAPSNATASTTMSQNELNERLQQLLALQQVQQTSPMQQTGYENLSHAQLLPLLTGGDLEASEQLSELLALQAALGASSPTSNGSGRVGPNANPLYKVSNEKIGLSKPLSTHAWSKSVLTNHFSCGIFFSGSHIIFANYIAD